MNDLIVIVAAKTGIRRADVREIIDAAFANISTIMANDDSVLITGFGKFSAKESAARKGRNPMTGEPIDIPAKKKIKFTPAKVLKEMVL
jgi:DNA-binding protein HU-beta